eukprot:CCRYP_011919-RA/>CCRYP_011919-RA protein AED:0.53 eAED:0.48 QI:0/-1/0/1/-1/1/1/0/103
MHHQRPPPDAPPDELRAIQRLKDLITGAATLRIEPAPLAEPEPELTNNMPPVDPLPLPIHISPDSIQTTPAARVTQNRPHVIPFDKTEYEPATNPEPRYNLRS